MSVETMPGPADEPRVLRAAGELDVASAPPLIPGLPALVEGAPAVILDLTEVAFLDSSGVRLVDRLARECGRRRIPFRAVAPPGTRARRLLDVVGLTETLVVDSLPAGLSAVTNDRP
jgi:anti-anti-sigma factor